MTNKPATEAWPAVITAQQFIDEGYAKKIATKQCQVFDPDGDWVETIVWNASMDMYLAYSDWGKGTWWPFNDDAEYQVRWLTAPQPTTDAPSAAAAGGDELAGNLSNAISDLGRNNYQEIEDKCNIAFEAYVTYTEGLEATIASLQTRLQAAEARERGMVEVLEQATHYSALELPNMSDTAQLSWLISMRNHVFDILQAASATAEGEES